MPIDPHFLTLAQWLSPAYPLGSFSFSHGLERAVAEGWVRDADSLEGWLSDLLTEGTGRMDAHWIALAHGASDTAAVMQIDAEARAFTPAIERLREAEKQGAAFARVTTDVWKIDLPAVLFPVAIGRAAGLMGMDYAPVTALYLHSFASNLVAAAQRLMPLGQTAAQGVVARLAPLCEALAHERQEPFSNAFISDIAAMTHETQSPRIFQS